MDGSLCVHHRFERQAARTPDAVALVYEDVRLTYGELNRRANRLAHRLRERGAGPERVVGILADRSAEMVVAVYAVLKSGAAYLPLDPSYPPERIALMLRDAGARLAVAGGAYVPVVEAAEVEPVELNADPEQNAPETDPDSGVNGENLAYVIYTSGSTGTPKGVMIEHAAIANHLRWREREAGIGPDDRVLQSFSFAFDPSVWEILGPLAVGGRTVVTRPRGNLDPGYLARIITEQGITALQAVPPVLRLLLEAGALAGDSPVRHVYVGGESLPAEVRDLFLASCGGALHNIWGATEATIGTTDWRCSAGDPAGFAAIGRALDGAAVHLLDERLRPVAVGGVGELFIGGLGVGRGYIGRPGLTADRFIPDPYAARPGARMYRTGDLARRLTGGAFEFLGRADHQVKIRGFRIEPGEVESVLAGHPAVRETLVAVREEQAGERRLVAYLGVGAAPGVSGAAPGVSVAALRDYAARRLPAHMVPAAFVLMDKLPLNDNGKVDRDALPEPVYSASEADGAFVPPAPGTQQRLAGIWCEVLGLERVSADDDFFHCGGHSLLAVRVLGRIASDFGTRLVIQDLFEHPVLADLAEHIDRAENRAVQPIPALAADAGPVGLSSAQERVWLHEELSPGSAAYVVPSVIRLRGDVDAEVLRRCWALLVERHAALRTRVSLVDGEPVQDIVPDWEPEIDVTDLTSLSAAGRAVRTAELIAEACRPFDLRTGPLLRLHLVRESAREHLLLMTAHHLVADGWSISLLVRELGRCYDALASAREPVWETIPITYRDFAAWQTALQDSTEVLEQLAWWRKQLAGAPALLSLPWDRPRPAVLSYRGGRQNVVIPAGTARALRELANRHNATLFMTLLAAHAALMARYSGEQDLVIGTPVAGRTRPELENVVGFFLNTLPLRLDLSGDPSFAELLETVRETCLEAFARQDVPFQRLVRDLSPERDLSHTPLFQTMVDLLNVPPADSDGAAELLPNQTDRGATVTELALYLEERGDAITGWLEYAADLFEPDTVRRMAAHLQALLTAAVADPDRPISRLPLTSVSRLPAQGPAACRPARSVHERIAEQARRTPDAVAVTHDGHDTTYAELESRANRLAHRLRDHGIGPECVVGILADRSAQMVVGVLATLKAGAAYLPLDPDYPAERLRHMLADSGTATVLTTAGLQRLVAEHTTIDLDPEHPDTVRRPDTPPEEITRPGNLAYLIYTSGSTGAPKGVAVPHEAIDNTLSWLQDTFRLGSSDVVAQKTSISFTDSVWEIFWTLQAGARLLIAPPDDVRDPARLHALLRTHKVTHTQFVPPQMKVFLDTAARLADPALPDLRWVFNGGEGLPAPLAEQWCRAYPEARIGNIYGMTETAVYATCEVVEPDADGWVRVLVGRPIAGQRAYVLDRAGRICPPLCTGEIFLGGASMARGYLGKPGLTAERFVPDPYADSPGARMYRTGDLGRFLPDGRIECLGRADRQVKIRGYRVELGEVETALRRLPGVRAAAVVADEPAGGDRRLVAFVVADSGDDDPGRLRRLLRGSLPDFLVPESIVPLDALPLGPTGKVDWRSLAAAPRPAAVARSRPPDTELEKLLAEIWAELLERPDGIGADDGVFDLGAHSLVATRFTLRVRDLLGVDLPLADIFRARTVAGLAAELARRHGDPAGLELVAGAIREVGAIPEEEVARVLAATASLDAASLDAVSADAAPRTPPTRHTDPLPGEVTSGERMERQ